MILTSPAIITKPTPAKSKKNASVRKYKTKMPVPHKKEIRATILALFEILRTVI